MGCLTNNLEIYPPRKAEKEKTVARWVVSYAIKDTLSRNGGNGTCIGKNADGSSNSNGSGQCYCIAYIPLTEAASQRVGWVQKTHLLKNKSTLPAAASPRTSTSSCTILHPHTTPPSTVSQRSLLDDRRQVVPVRRIGLTAQDRHPIVPRAAHDQLRYSRIIVRDHRASPIRRCPTRCWLRSPAQLCHRESRRSG